MFLGARSRPTNGRRTHAYPIFTRAVVIGIIDRARNAHHVHPCRGFDGAFITMEHVSSNTVLLHLLPIALILTTTHDDGNCSIDLISIGTPTPCYYYYDWYTKIAGGGISISLPPPATTTTLLIHLKYSYIVNVNIVNVNKHHGPPSSAPCLIIRNSFFFKSSRI